MPESENNTVTELCSPDI